MVWYGMEKLRGMGNISADANKGIVVSWQATPWFAVEGKTPLPLRIRRVYSIRTYLADQR